MKYIVVLGDGMADWKIEALGNKTCLEAARTPTLDKLAPASELGLCQTVPNGFKPGSDVANMSVLGFAPQKYYTGRSPLEAVSMGIPLAQTDVTLRCNLVTLSDEADYSQKTMLDYSAGEISTEEAEQLIDAVRKELGSEKYAFYCGISYRHCLVVKNGAVGHTLTPPHDISDKKICDSLPKGKNAEIYLDFMRKSYEILSKHPVNLNRINNGKRPANSIWLWGEGTKPALESFERLHGKRGGVISAVDLVKGVGMLAGLEILDVKGATGNFDTDFNGKANAAADALLKNGLDFVYIHIEAPDECGHHGDFMHKVYSIEQLDGVVKTLISRFECAGEDFAMLVCPDHYTPCAIKTHISDPVPYMLYSSRGNAVGTTDTRAVRYTEDSCKNSGNCLSDGFRLIEKLFAIK